MSETENDFWAIATWMAAPDDPEMAQECLRKWQTREASEINFETTDEIYYAASLLKQHQLPTAAAAALGALIQDIIAEAHVKKLAIERLGIVPKKGRAEDKIWKASIVYRISKLVFYGHSKTEAYELVAKNSHKSPDTVRRIYERAVKEYESRTGDK